MKHITVFVAGVLCAAAVFAADSSGDSTNGSPLKITISAGANLSDGNTEAAKCNASLLVEGEKEPLGSLRAGAEINYGESKVAETNRTDTDNGKVFINAKKTITKKTFAYGDASAMRDDMAELDYRIIAGPGLGFYAVKNARTSLSIESGVSYMWEKKNEVRSDAWALRAAERFELKITDTSKCWQSSEYLAPLEDFADYLLNAEVGVEADISSKLSLRLVLQDKYDNTPGEGLKCNDLALIAALSLKF